MVSEDAPRDWKIAGPPADLASDERAQLRALMDHAQDLIFFKDLHSRFVNGSKSLGDLLGTSPEELVGKSDFDYQTEECARKFVADEQTVIRTGKPLPPTVEKNVTKDGRVTWYLTSKMPVRDQAGAVIGIFGICKDITVLKEAEARLAHERDLLRSLMEHSTDCIYFKDRQSRFLRCSRGMCECFGLPLEQLIGKSDFDFFDESHAREAFEDEQNIIRTGVPIHGKVEREMWHEERERWALTSKMPLRNEAGEIIGTFGISKDITAIKEAEASLEKLHRQLVGASREAGMAEVATNVLHNVGNVLNSVNVSTTVLLETVTNSRIKKVGQLAALIREHAHELPAFLTSDPKGRQVPDYLDCLADELKLEQEKLLGEAQLTCKNIEHIKEIVMMQQSYARFSGVVEKVHPVELIEDALRMNDFALTRHHVQILRDYSPQVVEITAEKHKILQILVNLIRNAKYACDESERQDKWITVELRNGDGRVRFSVADNGVGITPENMDRIFNHGFTTRQGGHGFGLHSGALAAGEMGGTLKAQSGGHGCGARFTLDLPVQPPPNHDRTP